MKFSAAVLASVVASAAAGRRLNGKKDMVSIESMRDDEKSGLMYANTDSTSDLFPYSNRRTRMWYVSRFFATTFDEERGGIPKCRLYHLTNLPISLLRSLFSTSWPMKTTRSTIS